MSFLTSSRALSLIKRFSNLKLESLVGANLGSGSIIQVRTATKKVSGSKTSMRDSAGRRLGAKVAENEPVKTGQILMRQRGTRFYPGENASIGRDHTIFALEPGFVRFYLDPFHPKRKFVGVALRPDLRLPTSHFEPRVRRLGYVPIDDESKAKFEENNLSRKEHLARPSIIKQLEERSKKREELILSYSNQISTLLPSITKEDVSTASSRTLSIRNHIKSGTSLKEARAITQSVFLQELKLKLSQGKLSQAEYESGKSHYKSLSNIIDDALSFDNRFNLIAFTSEETRLSKVAELIQALDSIFEGRKGKRSREEIKELIHGSVFINAKEKKFLISKYLKTILPGNVGIVSAKQKSASVLKRWDYQKSKIEVIGRSKEAFAFK